jgi:hypothetical protein
MFHVEHDLVFHVEHPWNGDALYCQLRRARLNEKNYTLTKKLHSPLLFGEHACIQTVSKGCYINTSGHLA